MKRPTLRFISILLTIVMLIGLLPMALPTSAIAAAASNEIDEIILEFNPERVPKAGDPVRLYGDEILSTDIGRSYSFGMTSWCSDIPNRYDNEYVRHFTEINDKNIDIGYCYEAGKTYLFEIYFTIKSDFKNTHKFPDKEDMTFKLGNLPQSSYSVYVKESRGGTSARAFFAFTIGGSCPYEDIEFVHAYQDETFVYPPKADHQASRLLFRYHNFSASSSWEGEFKQSAYGATYYKAGEHYTQKIVLTAREGYRFASDVVFDFDLDSPDSITLSSDRKTLVVTFEYDVPDYIYINNIELINDLGTDLLPKGTMTDNYQLHVALDAPYGEDRVTNWQNEFYSDAGSFSANRVYSFSEIFYVRNQSEYKFPKDVSSTIQGIPADSYTVETEWLDDFHVRCTYTFHEGYESGVGQSAEKPLICHGFRALKWALENERVRFIELKNASNDGPPIKALEGAPKGSRLSGINVCGEKDLKISGDADFESASNIDQSAYYVYENLITIGEGATLNVWGDGSLTYTGNTPDWDNQVFAVKEGGTLIIGGPTITAKCTMDGCTALAITNMKGILKINGGSYHSTNKTNSSIGAIMVFGGETYIDGGDFEVEYTAGYSNWNYGLFIISANSGVMIERGNFYNRGIHLPNVANKNYTLHDYAANADHMILAGGAKYLPSEIDQEFMEENPNLPLKICKIIKKAEISLKPPAGSTNIYLAESKTEGVLIQETLWYANGSSTPLPNTASFTADNSYIAKVRIKEDSANNYILEELSHFTAKLNGKSAAIARDAGWYTITYNFGICKDVIGTVEIFNLNEPKEYTKADYSASTANSSIYGVSGIFWYEDGVEMQPGDLFKENHLYTVKIRIAAKNGYYFNVDGYNDPMMHCLINETGIGWTEPVPDVDPTKYAYICINYGYCPDQVVGTFDVQNVVTPVAGQKPSYTATTYGSGYRIDFDKENYSIEYGGTNAGNRSYYIRNGICWYDDTADKYVYENETFIAGHTYETWIYLENEPNYELLYNTDNDLYAEAYINGYKADLLYYPGAGIHGQRICYSFTCLPATISHIELMNITPPLAYMIPDQKIDISDPQLIQIDHFNWLRSDGSMVMPNEFFEGGETYQLEIAIKPIQNNHVDMCTFASGLTASAELASPSDVYAGTKSVYLYFDYVCKPPVNPFTDVDAGQWYFDSVLYSYVNGYMKGTSPAGFAPNMEFTREQFVQLLFNMEGLDPADYAGATGFTDVPAGQWYSAAVKWAKEEGITGGIGGGKFGLGGKVTREQLAKFLKNYANYCGEDTSARADLSAFADANQISDWAREDVEWAHAVGLLNSTSATQKLLAPGRVAMRSEVAKITLTFDAYRFNN